MRQQFILLLITFTTTAIPVCWAEEDPSEKNGETFADDSNTILQNAFHEILNRRRRAASDLVVTITYETKENKSISEFNQREKDFLLHVHNAYRSAVQPFAANMLEMIWDDEIAAFAQDWANQCQAEHRSNRNLSPWINMGENIFWSYSGKYHEGYATKFWWNEVQWYNYSTMACEAGQMCAHYITMVWAASARMGCGINRCSRLWALPDYGRGAYFIVCNYSGRFYSYTRPYTEHNTVCSHCFKTDAPKCRYNLCVTQEMLDNDIGYNGSTAEIGLNRTRTSSSIKTTSTTAPTTASLSNSTSFNTSNISSSTPTTFVSPETSNKTAIETSSLTSPETDGSTTASPDTTNFTSLNTTITTPTDMTTNTTRTDTTAVTIDTTTVTKPTNTSTLTYETSESTSLSTITSTYVSPVNTTTVTWSTTSALNTDSTTSNATAQTVTTSVSKPPDTTETTIKYETDDKPFILQAVDEIIEKFNSGNILSMFSLKIMAGIAILVSYVICN